MLEADIDPTTTGDELPIEAMVKSEDAEPRPEEKSKWPDSTEQSDS